MAEALQDCGFPQEVVNIILDFTDFQIGDVMVFLEQSPFPGDEWQFWKVTSNMKVIMGIQMKVKKIASIIRGN